MSPHNFISLVGQSFDRLLVIERGPNGANDGHTQWYCICICGAHVLIRSQVLRQGKARSCGCWRLENFRRRVTKHGKRYMPEYLVYHAMRKRCLNPKNNAFMNYGGRGIQCLWDSFEEFLNDMGPRPSPKHSIERRDNDGPYCKANCYWATYKEQANNKRNNVRIEYQGKFLTLSQVAECTGLSYKQIRHRIKHRLPFSH